MAKKKLPKQLLKKGKIQRGFSPDTTEAPIEELDAPEESILDTVERELKDDGIILFDNENILEDYLRLPADITEVPSKDLGRYFNTFTKQKMWTRTLLGRTGALLRELEEELDDIRDRVYSQLPAKMSVKEKELKLRSDERDGERAIELLQKVAIMQEKRKILLDYLENLVDAIFNISREISRRESDWNDETRENSIDRKRR